MPWGYWGESWPGIIPNSLLFTYLKYDISEAMSCMGICELAAATSTTMSPVHIKHYIIRFRSTRFPLAFRRGNDPSTNYRIAMLSMQPGLHKGWQELLAETPCLQYVASHFQNVDSLCLTCLYYSIGKPCDGIVPNEATIMWDTTFTGHAQINVP